MPAWIAQTYLNVPARGKIRPKDPPGDRVPEFQAPALDVVVWGTRSAFVHLTLVPLAIVITRGEKAKSTILTCRGARRASRPSAGMAPARKATIDATTSVTPR